MKPEPNFFLVNRGLLEHSWLTKNRSWQLAWIYIIGRANYQTGHVSLTEVYREITDLFTLDQWRYFIKRCVKEEMLSAVVAANRGDRAGYQQVGLVANYARYQGRDMSQPLEDVNQNGAHTERERSDKRSDKALETQIPDIETERRRSEDGARTESNKEYSKEGFKEVKPSIKATLPEWLDMEAWKDWETYNRERKWKLTPSTIKAQLKKLQALAENEPQTSIIHRAIERGWRSFFPDGAGNAKSSGRDVKKSASLADELREQRRRALEN